MIIPNSLKYNPNKIHYPAVYYDELWKIDVTWKQPWAKVNSMTLRVLPLQSKGASVSNLVTPPPT